MNKTDVLSIADTIRSMTDEELAIYLCGIVDCEVCPARQTCDATPYGYLQYLKSEYR